MKRWNTAMHKKAENPAIDAFLAEIQDVCKKHGFSLTHEDTQGAFVIVPYDEEMVQWLNDAFDETGEKK